MDIPDLNALFETGSPYFTPLSAAVLILILVLLFITLLSTAGYFPVLLSITSYTPIIARLKAKGVPYNNPELLEGLIQSGSVQDCMSRLKNMGYLTRAPLDCTPDQAEDELLLTWYEEVTLLRSQAPRDAWLFFDAILFFHEIARIKRILRFIHVHRAYMIMDKPELWPEGCTPDLAAKLSNVRTMNEGIRLLLETRYGQALLDGMPRYDTEQSLFYLELALDCMGYAELKRQMSMVQTYLASPYREYIAVLIDIHNLRVLIRAKHSGWNPDEVPLCLVDGGQHLPMWRLTQMNEMMSVPDVVRQLIGTAYDPILSPLLRSYPSADSMLHLDLALDQYLLDTVSRLGLVYYHTGGPLLWYLVAKEYELRNIRIILSGLYEGFSPEQIIQMMVRGPEET
ncbi:MAG TPA: V-type ATPase subunit [Methanospirillum sp.]|nr:V-type ATPase subunit [Methanospirillum sp.]